MRREVAERGQVLIILVLGIVGLLAAAGLAIDGGTALQARRRMQNAADAVSLAGTRELAKVMCEPDTPANDDLEIWRHVIEYAGRNGVADPNDVDAQYVKLVGGEVVAFDPPELVGNGGAGVPNGASGVAATTLTEHPTYFMSVIGRPTAAARASASAVTGRAAMAGGLRPFGIPEEVALLENGECFTMTFSKPCEKFGEGETCLIEYLDGQTASHRGWMNLSYVWNQGDDSEWYRAVNSNPMGELADWMEFGWDEFPIYADCGWGVIASPTCFNGDFIHAKPGQESVVIKVAPLDTPFTIPVFDQFPNCDGEDADLVAPWPVPPGAAADACTGMAGADYYHIIGFAGVTIHDKSISKKRLEVCLTDLIIEPGLPFPDPEGYGSPDACAMHAMTITLWE